MPPGRLRFVEVAPRDGLQNERSNVPLKTKIRFVDALSKTGVGEIEAGAFVSPRAVPQMADSEAVFAGIRRRAGVVYSGLVPNEMGLDRALSAGVAKVAIFTAASETFNQRNIRTSIAGSFKRLAPVARRSLAAGLPLRGYVSTAFFCPYEGKVDPRRVVPVVERLLALGAREVSIGDTIGRASPSDVRRLLERLLKRVSAGRLFLHFHDTYGMAIANALTAWREFGITGFDASSGGLGGCPYAPGASGNVALEDLAFAFWAEGARTGIDLQAIRAATAVIEPALGRRCGSRLGRVGL